MAVSLSFWVTASATCFLGRIGSGAPLGLHDQGGDAGHVGSSG